MELDEDVRRHLDGVTHATRARRGDVLALCTASPVSTADVGDRDRLRGVPLPLRERARGRRPGRPASPAQGREHDLPGRRGRGARLELARLGPHTTGVGCLYVKDLDDVDLAVLEGIVASSYASVRDGTYTSAPGGHRELTGKRSGSGRNCS